MPAAHSETLFSTHFLLLVEINASPTKFICDPNNLVESFSKQWNLFEFQPIGRSVLRLC